MRNAIEPSEPLDWTDLNVFSSTVSTHDVLPKRIRAHSRRSGTKRGSVIWVAMFVAIIMMIGMIVVGAAPKVSAAAPGCPIAPHAGPVIPCCVAGDCGGGGGGGGGPTYVTYTYEGPSGVQATIDGQALSQGGGTVSLPEGQSVPVSFSGSGFDGWACTGSCSFSSPGSSSTSFDVGSGGYIYAMSNYGDYNAWGGYILGDASYDAASALIDIPQSSAFSGSVGDQVQLWVGLGQGISSNPTFFQAGVTIELVSNGDGGTIAGVLSTWYEAYPQVEVSVPTSDVPTTMGGSILIQISIDDGYGIACFTVTTEYCVEDSYSLGGAVAAGSAEWMVEPGFGGYGFYPMPDISSTSPVKFVNLAATTVDNAGNIETLGGYTMINAGNPFPQQSNPTYIDQTMTPPALVTGDFTSGFDPFYTGPA